MSNPSIQRSPWITKGTLASFLFIFSGTSCDRDNFLIKKEEPGSEAAPGQNLGTKPAPSPHARACTTISLYGLNVGVLFAPGLSPAGKVTIINGAQTEDHMIGDGLSPNSSQGFRTKGEDGVIRVWRSTFVSGAPETAGTFQVVVETQGQKFKKDNIVVERDECHVKPKTIYIEIDAPGQTPLDPSKEYYQLQGNLLFELNPQNGAGKIVGENSVYTDVEVVRVLTFTETQGSGPSASTSVMSREEKTVSGKVKLGTFTERNIDRGPLPAGAVQDDGERVLYAKKRA